MYLLFVLLVGDQLTTLLLGKHSDSPASENGIITPAAGTSVITLLSWEIV